MCTVFGGKNLDTLIIVLVDNGMRRVFCISQNASYASSLTSMKIILYNARKVNECILMLVLLL